RPAAAGPPPGSCLPPAARAPPGDPRRPPPPPPPRGTPPRTPGRSRWAPPRTAPSRRLRHPRLHGPEGPARRRGERHEHLGPLSGTALHPDPAPVLLDDPEDHRQPQPGPLAEAGLERLERLADLRGAHPDPFVGERDQDSVALARHRDRQDATARHRLERV